MDFQLKKEFIKDSSILSTYRVRQSILIMLDFLLITLSNLISIDIISDCLFFTNTISQAMTNTTLVRMAVPKLESIPEIPILPKIDVRLANTADKIA